MDRWIHDEILDGLMRLLCLSLERTPAADVIEATANVWVEAICHNRQFDKAEDQQRFRDAFKTLAIKRKAWPAPADLMEAMPKRRELLSLPNKGTCTPGFAEKSIEEMHALIRKLRDGGANDSRH